MKRHACWLVRSLSLLAVLCLSGCSGKKPVTVQGKLILPQGMKLAETDSVVVRFLPQDPKGKAGATTVNVADASFTVTGVTAGPYKLAVAITPYQGMPESQARAVALDPFNKKFDEHATPLHAEVTGTSDQAITVDLGQGTVR